MLPAEFTATGHKGRGGRPVGVKSKAQMLWENLTGELAQRGVNPFQTLALISEGNIDCAACRGAGKTAFQPRRGQGRLAERVCESCYGSGKEKVTPDVRLRASAELAKYLRPQLRAIEHSGTVGVGVVDLTEILIRRRDALAKRLQEEQDGGQANAEHTREPGSESVIVERGPGQGGL